MSTVNYGMVNPFLQRKRETINGSICFVGVTRDVNPDESILAVQTQTDPSPDYTVDSVDVLVADNTGSVNATLVGATVGNESSFVIIIGLTLKNATKAPVVTTAPSLNPTGGGSAMLRQVIPFDVSSTTSTVKMVYVLIIDGATQKDSNDLFEMMCTPTMNSFFSDQPLTSCINFALGF